MAQIDLNSDLGESFGAWSMGEDEALLSTVTSANVACGFHAGDPATMLRTVQTALANDVAVGAHPGYRDLAGFGRRAMDVSHDELFSDVLYQMGALMGLLHSLGGGLAYVKPHGALYNRIVTDQVQAEAVASAVLGSRLRVPMLGLPNSAIQDACTLLGLPFYEEAFVDRGYLPDGTLVPRGQPGALLHDVEQIAARAVRMVTEGVVEAVDGSLVEMQPASLCVHGDTPGAMQMALAVRSALENAGVGIARFS